jgi:hypothetical protein
MVFVPSRTTSRDCTDAENPSAASVEADRATLALDDDDDVDVEVDDEAPNEKVVGVVTGMQGDDEERGSGTVDDEVVSIGGVVGYGMVVDGRGDDDGRAGAPTGGCSLSKISLIVLLLAVDRRYEPNWA